MVAQAHLGDLQPESASHLGVSQRFIVQQANQIAITGGQSIDASREDRGIAPTGPVAIDCVLWDLLSREVSLSLASDDYLQLAAQAGLGVFEHAPSGNDRVIDDRFLDLGAPGGATPYGGGKAGSGGFVPSIAGAGTFTLGTQGSIDVAGLSHTGGLRVTIGM